MDLYQKIAGVGTLVGALGLSGCHTPKNTVPALEDTVKEEVYKTQRKFETIDKGEYCGHESSGEYVIKNVKNWENLWGQIISISFPKPEVPEINFEKDMVLGVFVGTIPTGGYSIEISKIVEKDSCLEVYIQGKTPEMGDRVTMALTQPYHLVRTAKTDKEVKYIRENQND